MWTPYQIEIILHHHTGRGRFPRHDAPAYNSTLSDLIHDGVLIDEEPGLVTTTPMGRALVEMWMKTPLPEQKWVDPRFTYEAQS